MTRTSILVLGLPLAAALCGLVAPARALGLPGFEANLGQLPDTTRFAAIGAGHRFEVRDTGAIWLPAGAEGRAVRLEWVGASSTARFVAEAKAPGEVHYYRGADPSGWTTGVPLYARLRQPGVFAGVDAVYHWRQRHVQVDLEVAPGADPEQIALRFVGADEIVSSADGEILIRAGGAELRWTAPVVYQRTAAGRTRVPAEQVLDDTGVVRFTIDAYDRSRQLVVDPVVLVSSTRFGGSLYDEALDVAVDSGGTRWITGTTTSTDFLGQPAAATLGDAFVLKVAPDGELGFIALLGGDGADTGWGIAVDDAGRAVVAGHTESTDFPTVNAYQASLGNAPDPDSDAFLVRLSASGNLLYGTYFGGADLDGQFDGGLALHGSGRAYFASRTNTSTGLPTTAGAFQTSCSVAPCAFVAGFDPSASGAASFVYGTYLSGNSSEGGLALDVDAAENLYVFGFTGSTSGLVDPAQGFQSMTGDALNRDHFVVKLDPSATGAGQRAYSTYLGGLGDETEGGDIVADDSGKLWVTGDTTSTSSSFPVDDPMVVQPENAGGADGYVVAVDTTLTGAASRRWSTFLGGSEDDAGSGIAVDSLGTVWVGLNGRSDDLVLEAPLPMFELPSPSTGGGYLVRLSEDGETTLLTTPVPSATRLDVDGTDRIHLIGSTTAGHAIVDALPPSPAGQLEGFAAIVEPVADTGLQLTADGTTDTAAVGQLVAFRYTMTNRGESTATGLELTASVPAGLSNPAPPAGCLVASGQMTCQGLPDLAPGEDLRLSLRGTTVSTGILTTTGTANAAQADSVPGDNTAGATITVGSIPFSSPLPVASLDAVGATYDIGGFAIDTASGVDASANGSLDDVINFMWFDGSVPIRLLALRGGAEVALGFVERTTWTPSDGDGGDLFGREFNAPADRVFVAVDAFGRFELRSAAAFDPGVVIATGSLDLGHTGGLHLELAGGVARLYHGSALVAEASPFTGASGAATQAAVGDDQVLAVGFGLGELGSASFAGPELPLFADGFESGDTTGWTSAVP